MTRNLHLIVCGAVTTQCAGGSVSGASLPNVKWARVILPPP